MKFLAYQCDFIIRNLPKKRMKINPTTRAEELVQICDDLLSSTGALRSICEAMQAPWDKSAAAKLINRILDIRNQVSPPKKPQPK